MQHSAMWNWVFFSSLLALSAWLSFISARLVTRSYGEQRRPLGRAACIVAAIACAAPIIVNCALAYEAVTWSGSKAPLAYSINDAEELNQLQALRAADAEAMQEVSPLASIPWIMGLLLAAMLVPSIIRVLQAAIGRNQGEWLPIRAVLLQLAVWAATFMAIGVGPYQVERMLFD